MSIEQANLEIIAVDTGGTFTDIVYLRDQALHVKKVPSTPDDPSRALIEGVNAVAYSLIHGSTVATNALLEQKGARVALITNRGFEDVIEIGRQNRPQLYGLSGTRPPSLVARALRFGIAGRLDHNGAEIEALDEADIVALKEKLNDTDAIAVCLLHSYANASHERRVGALLGDEKPLSLSCDLLPEYREYERTATTVVNAYVAPLMARYLARIENDSSAERVRIMGSAGGVMSVGVARREPVQTVLSGPAGGVAGALASARAAGIANIISFDMGGTSTDVSLCPGGPLYTREFTIAGLPVAIPVLDIHTVGAGGGSIAWCDAGGALRVGPRSAGAVPGPICYGRGGTSVTVTDANVWLGRLPEHAFLGGDMTLDRAAIETPLAQLAERIGLSLDDTAAGIVDVVNSTMEGALRVISVERGYDPIDFTLVAFGGAAGLHAADLADRLGIPGILVPEHPGVLSAFGMLASPIRKSASRTVLARDENRIDAVFEEIEAAARAAMRAEGIEDDVVRTTRWIDARYYGQSYELRVPAGDWVNAFHAAHARRYGYSNPDAAVEAVTLRVEALSPTPELPAYAVPQPVAAGQETGGNARRESLDSNPTTGPIVITEYSATTWVPDGWTIERHAYGLLMRRTER